MARDDLGQVAGDVDLVGHVQPGRRLPTLGEEVPEAGRRDEVQGPRRLVAESQEALLLETAFLGDSNALRALPDLARDVEDPGERLAEAVRTGAAWTLDREARLR
jgi:hypothetical protein